MRSLKTMGGLVAALAMTALVASPAYAVKKEKPKVPTGNFIANINGQEISPTHKAIAKSNKEGEIEEFVFGGIHGIECKSISSISEVESEKSPDLKMDLAFNGCTYPIKAGEFTRREPVKFKHSLHMVLHANGSVKIVQIAEDETEVKVPPFKCKIKIPAQEVPLAAEKKEGEFEAVEYGTEIETVEGGKLKKYPRGFFERLEVEFTAMKHLKMEFKPEPGAKSAAKCGDVKGEEGHFNPETGMVEGKWGFVGALEEIEIHGGSIGFEPAV
jgi:hypothetical protein